MSSGDAAVVTALGAAVRDGRLRMHVNYRRARRDRRFHAGLVALAGRRTVLVRDLFMPVSLGLLLCWFFVAEGLGWHAVDVRLFGQPMPLGTVTFLALLLCLVMVARTEVRKVQGPPLAQVATADPALFADLWNAGAVALMSRAGEPRICQSPRGDWRQFVRHHAMQF